MNSQRSASPSDGGDFEVSFRGWRIDIRPYRLEHAGNWSAEVNISRGARSEPIAVMDAFPDSNVAGRAGLEAALNRVDVLCGGPSKNAVVKIHELKRSASPSQGAATQKVSTAVPDGT